MNDLNKPQEGTKNLQIGILIGKVSSMEKSHNLMMEKMDRFIENTNKQIERIEKSIITCNYNTNNKVDFKDLNERLEPIEDNVTKHSTYWKLLFGLPLVLGAVASIIFVIKHFNKGG